MTERPWTPGPWEINHNPYGDCIAKGGKSFVALWTQSMDGTAFPATANARLIAAAPDLYEALSVFVELLMGDPDSLAKARAALAKANPGGTGS